MKIGLFGTTGDTHGVIFTSEDEFLDYYYESYIDPFKQKYWRVSYPNEEVHEECDIVFHIDTIHPSQIEMLKL